MGLPLRWQDLIAGKGVDLGRLGEAERRSLDFDGTNPRPIGRDAPQPAPARPRAPRKSRAKAPPAPPPPPAPRSWAGYAAQVAGLDLAPGTEIARFRVAARPVPWSVPNIRGKRTCKNKRLLAWQAKVATAARLAMDGRTPYYGHVKILLRFALVPANNGSEPDWTNLAKGTEDALQDIVFGNDRKVVGCYTEKVESWQDYAVIKVVAAERIVETKGGPGE